MSRWSVWQIGRGGAPERVGTYTSGADARRVLRAAVTLGATVDPDGELDESRGLSLSQRGAMERAAETWLATAAPTMPAPPEVIAIPEPVAFEPPVVALRIDDSVRDLALDEYAERTAAAEAFAVQAEKDLAALREQLDVERAQVRALTAERDGLRIALEDARRPAKIIRLTAPPAPKPRRHARATETPLGTLFRRIDERARGIR